MTCTLPLNLSPQTHLPNEHGATSPALPPLTLDTVHYPVTPHQAMAVFTPFRMPLAQE